MNRPEQHFRARLAVLVAGGALIAALFPMAGSVLAAIGTPVIGAQAPNPVAVGSSATYAVTTTTVATPFDTRITNVTGLPAGATFSSDCVVSTTTGSVDNLLTITTTGSTPPGTSPITVTVTSTVVNAACGTGAADATATQTASLVVDAGAFTKLQILVPGETAAPGTATGKTGTPTAQAAGTAFNVTVNSVDPNWNVVSSNHVVRITSSSAGAILPANAALVAGTRTFSVTLNSAGSRTVTATDVTNAAITANTSAAIAVSAGAFTKLQVLVPGETAAPGTTTGKTGSPAPQAAGTAFPVTVNAVDPNWNVVSSTDVVRITSTDGAATLPANTALAAGTRLFSVTLNTLGSMTVTATDITDSTKTANTSPAITVHGAFAKLQVLVPGETAAPGTTTGKTGTPTAQTAGTAFTITVNAVDANWNVVSSTNTVRITSSDTAATLPADAALVAGTKTFSVTLNSAGSRTVTATDITDATKTANTSAAITVNAGGATKLGFTSQPGASTSNVAFTIQPVVTIQDLGGNTITTAAATTVTLSLGVNPSAATLTCTGGNTRTTSLGVATFSGCTINNAGVGYTLVASATGYTSATSTAFNVTAPGATITLTRSRGMITYGETVTFSVQFGTGGGNRPFVLEYQSVGVPFATIASLTTDAAGFASFTYTPTRTGYIRARFAGTPDLGAANSTVFIVGVRQTVKLGPTHTGTLSIARGRSIAFRVTVRPIRADLAASSVTYRFYHKVSGSWVLATERHVLTDSTGVARTTFKFTQSGGWYVRAYAPRTPYNSITRFTQRELFSVQ